MGQLQHPHVVRVHEVGEHEGKLFMATDFVRGGTLEDWCREHPPGARPRFVALLDLMLQATRGLAAAHAAAVVGMPLGPGDMLVDDEGRLRLRGWTLASATIDEHERSEGEPDARDDQRALCRTFWEAALGSPAPAAEAAGAAVRMEVPAWFLAVLQRGLAAERRDRWPHADALRAALERGRDGRRWTIAALLGGAGLAVTLLGLLRPAGGEGCTLPDDAPSHRWAAQRPALEERFVSSSIAAARNHSVHTVGRLDGFAAQWDAEHLATCGVGDRVEARLACLERAATSFGVVLDEIEQLEPRHLGRASTLTLALPDLAPCRDPDPTALDEARDAAAREAARRLDEAGTLVNLRRMTKAEQIVRELEAEGWVGSPSVESRGRLVLAHAAYARDDYETARRHALAALTAAELAGDPAEAAAAWGSLATAELARSRLDEAAFAAERLESLATHAKDVLQLADAARVMAIVEMGRGRRDEAMTWFDTAERYLRAELGEQHVRLATLQEDMVETLVLLGQRERAVASARAAVSTYEALLGPESLRTIRARGTLGNALADLGAREEAIEELGHAEEALAADPDASPGERFMFALKRAELLGLVGRTDEAVAALERLDPPSGDREAAMVRSFVLGSVLLESGRAAEASTVYEGLLATLQGNVSHATAINRAAAHVNLALALARSGRATEAAALVEPTIAEYEALAMPPARVGNAWIEFVEVYRAAGRLEDARRAAERGVALLERGHATPEALARARTALAAIELARREREAAP